MGLTVNTPLTLASGLSVPAGAYIRITEDYSNVNAEGSTIRFQTFIDQAARSAEPMKEPISAIQIPSSIGDGVVITGAEWEAQPKHVVLYGKLKAAIEAVTGAGTVVNS